MNNMKSKVNSSTEFLVFNFNQKKICIPQIDNESIDSSYIFQNTEGGKTINYDLKKFRVLDNEELLEEHINYFKLEADSPQSKLIENNFDSMIKEYIDRSLQSEYTDYEFITNLSDYKSKYDLGIVDKFKQQALKKLYESYSDKKIAKENPYLINNIKDFLYETKSEDCSKQLQEMALNLGYYSMKSNYPIRLDTSNVDNPSLYTNVEGKEIQYTYNQIKQYDDFEFAINKVNTIDSDLYNEMNSVFKTKDQFKMTALSKRKNILLSKRHEELYEKFCNEHNLQQVDNIKNISEVFSVDIKDLNINKKIYTRGLSNPFYFNDVVDNSIERALLKTKVLSKEKNNIECENEKNKLRELYNKEDEYVEISNNAFGDLHFPEFDISEGITKLSEELQDNLRI